MREISLAFGPGQALVGTLTLPAADLAAPAAPLGLVMFNSGVVHRIGPHRINVKLARQLALRGIPSIRFDLHGMGDSLRADGVLPYERQVVADLGLAMDALQDCAGVARFALLGFCSGAVPSYLAAQADPRVGTVILYDAFAFPTPRSRARFLWLRLNGQGFSLKTLRIYARKLGRSLAQLPRRLFGRLRPRGNETFKPVGSPEQKHQIVRGLGELTRRGVKVVVLHAGDDFGTANYAEQFRDAMGDALPREGLRCGFLATIDHVATSTPAQKVFLDAICAALLGDHLDCMPADASPAPAQASPAAHSAAEVG
ncbi:alpha/beta hydrolase family protein [mine drainage metagenome]|uniref:Alpha/beta hydrolase family protein n=1 Tax=mine drainage metagenome TaxID=410659 RepID=A0A1J5R9B1_9ZZZZ